MKYPKIDDYYYDFHCIDKYNGKPKQNFNTEKFHKYLDMIQHMISDYHPLFEGFDYNTIYIIDCATYQCLSRKLELDSKINSEVQHGLGV